MPIIQWVNKPVLRIVSIALALVFALSAFMAGSLAWSSLRQSALNETRGSAGPRGSLTVAKTVANADGSELTDGQLAMEFDFTVVIGGVTYEFTLRHGESKTFAGLPVDTAYTVTERNYFAQGYATTSENSAGDIPEGSVTAAFTNTYEPDEPETGHLEITKEVVDADGSALAGEQLEVEFTFTAEIGGVTHEFTLRHGESKRFDDLPLGTTYVVTETPAEGCTAARLEYTGTISVNGETVTLPFVNVYVEEPEDKVGSLAVRKEVRGSRADQGKKFDFTVVFGNLPEEPVTILVGGEEATLSAENAEFTFELAHDDEIKFENLPHGVTYTVTEPPAEGYHADFTAATGTIAGDHTAAVRFINRMPDIPEPEVVKITVTKRVEGNPPARDADKTFRFTVTFNDLPDEPVTILAGGREEILSAGNRTFTFEIKKDESFVFENIPRGISYSVAEDDYAADGYARAGVTNGSGAVGRADIIVVQANTYRGNIRITTSGTKTWDLTGAPPGAQLPASIVVYLKDGDEIVDTAVVRPDAAGNWTFTFTAPKYRGDGETEIHYTVEEVPVDGWQSVVTGYDIANTWTGEEYVEISVRKVWDDHSNPDRPQSIQVQLKKDGAAYSTPATLNAANGWEFRWMGLEKGPVWTVDETAVPEGYTRTIAGSAATGFVITNTRVSEEEKASVSVTKVWQDGGSPDRPAGAAVQLYRNGTAHGAPVTLNNGNGWKHTWAELPIRPTSPSGEPYVWTVDEPDVPVGYTKSISGDAVNGFAITNSKSTIVETTAVKVTKVWVDDDNPERPTSVSVQLYKDGQAHGNAVTLNAANQWTYTWSGLEKDPVWTIDEAAVPAGYTKSVTGSAAAGYIVTNTRGRTPPAGEVLVSGCKTWSHGNNPESQRPRAIILYIKADGVVIRQREITAADHWSWNVRLDKYDINGREIVYTVDERSVPGYKKTVNGFNLHNAYDPSQPGGPGGPGKPTLPQTDDPGNLVLWLVVMGASLVGLLIVIVMYRRRKKSEEELFRHGLL